MPSGSSPPERESASTDGDRSGIATGSSNGVHRVVRIDQVALHRSLPSVPELVKPFELLDAVLSGGVDVQQLHRLHKQIAALELIGKRMKEARQGTC